MGLKTYWLTVSFLQRPHICSHLILTVDNRLQFMQYDLPEKQSKRTFEYVNNILFAVNKISNL